MVSVRNALASSAVAVLTVLTWSGSGSAAPAPLQLSGDLVGLQSGHSTVLQVQVRNGADEPVTLRGVRVTAVSSDSGCPADALRFDDWQGVEVLAPGAVFLAPVRAQLAAVASCGSWDLTYLAT